MRFSTKASSTSTRSNTQKLHSNWEGWPYERGKVTRICKVNKSKVCSAHFWRVWWVSLNRLQKTDTHLSVCKLLKWKITLQVQECVPWSAGWYFTASPPKWFKMWAAHYKENTSQSSGKQRPTCRDNILLLTLSNAPQQQQPSLTTRWRFID